MKNLFTRLLFLILTLLFAGDGLAQTSNEMNRTSRAKALATLKGCATRPITLGCSEDTAGYVIELFDRGDRALLKPLLNAGLKSDGALAEMLGDFYANLLWKHPQMFLEALKVRSIKEQRQLAGLASRTDGGGMSGEMLRDIRRTLRRYSARRCSRLASVARICLVEVNKVNAMVRNQ